MIFKGSILLNSNLRKILREVYCDNQRIISSLKNRKYSTKFSKNSQFLSGIFPTITTPFTKLQDESISWNDLDSNLLNLSKLDFRGIVVNDYFAEYPCLTHQERDEIIKAASNVIGSEKVIIAGTSSESLKKTIQICETMKNLGADYSLLSTPFYFKKQMTYQALLDYFTKVADNSPIPILLNNIPSLTLMDLPPELILDLADHPNIVGLKESSQNIAKIAYINDKLKEKPNYDFSILSGSDSFLLDALRVGATGGICALASIFGQELIELFKMNKLEKGYTMIDDENSEMNKKQFYKKANRLQSKLASSDLAILETFGVSGLKAAMDIYGLYGGPCRLPLTPLNEDEINLLKSSLELIGFKLNQ